MILRLFILALFLFTFPQTSYAMKKSSPPKEETKKKSIRIFCFDDAHEDYKKAIHHASKNSDHETLGDVVIDWSKKGESSAIYTLLFMMDQKERIKYLEHLKAQSTLYESFWAMLGKDLLDDECPESLFCLQYLSEDYLKKEPDSLYNYVLALGKFGNQKSDLEKALELTFQWRDRDPSLFMDVNEVTLRLSFGKSIGENQMFLMSLYGMLLDMAKKASHKRFFNIFFLKTREKRDGIGLSMFLGEGLRDQLDPDFFYEKTGSVICSGRVNATVEKVKEDISAQAIYLEKNKTERQNTLPGIVYNNLALILKDPALKNFYKTQFNLRDPNFLETKHITIWARAIINSQRQALLQYEGQNIALQDQLLMMDNFTLEGHVVNALKEILGMD